MSKAKRTPRDLALLVLYLLLPSPRILYILISISIVSIPLIIERTFFIEDTLNQDTLKAANEKNEPNFVWSKELEDWTLQEGTSKDTRAEKDRGIELEVWTNISRRDRIVDQLRLRTVAEGDKIFKLLPPDRGFIEGQSWFIESNCLVDKCEITYDDERADALIFQNSDVFKVPPKWRRAHQVWIAYLLESPMNTFDKRLVRRHRGQHTFNWTATYRTDSDIVTPYSKFIVHEKEIHNYKLLKSIERQRLATVKAGRNLSSEFVDGFVNYPNEEHKNLIEGKLGKVAWMASNCYASNNRLEYARQLSNHIQVDIYGKCGQLNCDKRNQTGCLDMINRRYKFYLSFENSNSPQYITEKLFQNALGHNDQNYLVLPIVMGPPRSDYEQVAPPNSFIHVDDFNSPQELANYLNVLDSTDTLYYSYFHWKTVGRFIDTKFLCRVCALLHLAFQTGEEKTYSNLRDWWLENGTQETTTR